MAKIEITDLQNHVHVDRKLILQTLRRVLKAEGRVARSLSIVVTDNRHIRDLNREYLDHDYPTDVISFPLDDGDWPELERPGAAAGGGINGEIIASAELAVRQAAAMHGDAQAELLLYLIHGLLHLMGYDDLTPEDAKRMHEREDALLEECGFAGVFASRPSAE